jgi:hypothetical protein
LVVNESFIFGEDKQCAPQAFLSMAISNNDLLGDCVATTHPDLQDILFSMYLTQVHLGRLIFLQVMIYNSLLRMANGYITPTGMQEYHNWSAPTGRIVSIHGCKMLNWRKVRSVSAALDVDATGLMLPELQRGLLS